MKDIPATRSQFFLIQLVFFISSFHMKLRFKAASLSKDRKPATSLGFGSSEDLKIPDYLPEECRPF